MTVEREKGGREVHFGGGAKFGGFLVVPMGFEGLCHRIRVRERGGKVLVAVVVVFGPLGAMAADFGLPRVLGASFSGAASADWIFADWIGFLRIGSDFDFGVNFSMVLDSFDTFLAFFWKRIAP